MGFVEVWKIGKDTLLTAIAYTMRMINNWNINKFSDSNSSNSNSCYNNNKYDIDDKTKSNIIIIMILGASFS